jgi:tetratricopeptide (TPR) repeat protein
VLRETLLADVPAVERRRVHARVAAALRSRRRGAASPELAHHLVEAGVLGDPAEARDAAAAVARQALERLAYDEAARWFGRALEAAAHRDAVHGPDLRDRYGLLLARGDALYRSGQVLTAREALVDAVEVAMELDDLDAVAGAAAALTATGGIWTWVDIGEVPPQVLRTLRSVLDRLGGTASAARARLLSTVATGLYYGDDPALVDALSAEAVTVAHGLDDPALLADVLLDRAFVQRLPDGAEATVALADEVLGLPGLTDLQVVVAHGRRLFGLLHAGDLPAAVDAHRRAADLARTAHLLAPQVQLSHFPAGMAAAEGRYDDAERLIAQAAAREELVDLPRLTTGVVGVEAVVLKHRGRLGERAGLLQWFAAGVPLRTLHQLAALALVAAGEPDAAREAWHRSAAAADVPWLELVADTVEVELREALLPRPGTPCPEDLALLAALRSHEHMLAAAGTAYPWVPVALPLGALEHRLGLLDEAEAHLRRALARSEGWGTHTWSTLARWRLAAVLRERGAHAEAAREAARARADAHRMGLVLPAVGEPPAAPGPA